MAFLINGVAPTSTDPVVEIIGPDTYGVQGNGVVVYGPFRSFRFLWAIMTDADFASLALKQESLGGAEATVTASLYSSTAWQAYTANLLPPTGQRDYQGYVRNVSMDAIRARAAT